MSAAQERVIDVILALQGRSFQGLRLTQIAKAVSQSATTTLRDLEALEAKGVTERIPGMDDHWRLGPRLVQLALAHQQEMAALQRSVDDFTARYSRAP